MTFLWYCTYSGSTTGALEAAYTQATGKPISLSEQQLVDCAGPYNNFGCNGGLPSQAFEYIKYNGGLDTEESYPYKGVNEVCHYKPENAGVRVLDSVNITLVRNLILNFNWYLSRMNYFELIVCTYFCCGGKGAEDELKNAVGLVRPVSVAFEVIDGFRMYKSGVYTSDHCGTTPMVSIVNFVLFYVELLFELLVSVTLGFPVVQILLSKSFKIFISHY
jgi:cathepsin H